MRQRKAPKLSRNARSIRKHDAETYTNLSVLELTTYDSSTIGGWTME